MISELNGRLTAVSTETAHFAIGSVVIDVLMPAAAHEPLRARIDQQLTIFTVLYLDGSLASGALIPRLVGFIDPEDRALFQLMGKVRGVSTRKALRAMAAPTAAIADAIVRGDVKWLTGLPEIGKRTAELMVAELRDAARDLAVAPPATVAAHPVLSNEQQVAVDIIVAWGDKRADAQRWVAAAVETHPDTKDPEEIVRAAYRLKRG